jgi:DNA-directed RNA polymerase specialized sigma24 family protein
MAISESTCWTVIRAAAAGSPADREELARRYLPVVRAYLAARWRGSGLRPDVDDAVQEVFVECFRQGGALEAAWAGRVPSFRAFLNGVVRNVARRFESRPVRAATPLPENQADEESLSRLFERTWAQAIMSEAAQLPAATAAALWLLAIGKGAALRQLSVCGLYGVTRRIIPRNNKDLAVEDCGRDLLPPRWHRGQGIPGSVWARAIGRKHSDRREQSDTCTDTFP